MGNQGSERKIPTTILNLNTPAKKIVARPTDNLPQNQKYWLTHVFWQEAIS